MRTSIVLLSLFLAACTSQTDTKTAATVKDGKAVTTTAAGKAAPLDAAASKVGFIGAKITADHEGSFGEFTGSATIDGETPTGITLTVQTKSIQIEPEKLKGHLSSADFFDVEKFPTATFTSSSITAKADGANTHVVEGSLELRGVTKTITFPAAITVAADKATGKAEFTINRKDFGIEYAGMPDDLIKDNVVLKLDLTFKRG